jgi:hypothetical protein
MPSTPHEEPILGATFAPLALDSGTLIREASEQMASQARRELLLFGHTLDPDLYNRRAFVSAVKRLALSRPHLPVRILTFDPQRSGRHGHRLIEMARQLTSRIAIRRVTLEDQERLDAFLIADERGYIRRRLADTMNAICDFNAPGEARRLKAEFEQIWTRADADPELRRLFI